MAINVDYSASLITYVLVLYKFLPCLCYKSLFFKLHSEVGRPTKTGHPILLLIRFIKTRTREVQGRFFPPGYMTEECPLPNSSVARRI